jgi:hypothetical protein
MPRPTDPGKSALQTPRIDWINTSSFYFHRSILPVHWWQIDRREPQYVDRPTAWMLGQWFALSMPFCIGA